MAALRVSPVKAGGQSDAEAPRIATNTYPWRTFAQRSNRDYERHAESLLADIASTGIVGYEPILEGAVELDGLGDLLNRQGLEMRSIYVNSVLHKPKEVNRSIDNVLKIASSAHRLGTRIVVTNPAPIRWGGDEDKSDTELRLQAKSLGRLGAELRKLGMVLAYHNHDAEWRQGGREFHHMLVGTDPVDVKLCLDAHWIFRGCGNSEVAVFDVLQQYDDRIVELHLRQSERGVWREDFSPTGDIDYLRIFRYLADQSVRPHFVLEQAVEASSPAELSAVEAHRRGLQALKQAIS